MPPTRRRHRDAVTATEFVVPFSSTELPAIAQIEDLLSPTAREQLPPRVTRKQAAAVVSAWYFPCSPRTLEAAPIRYQRIPGLPALIHTIDLLQWAQAKIDSAPIIRGGRKRRGP
jgi:hypothetical protein